MKLFVAYVPAHSISEVAFNPSVHCQEVDTGFSLTMTEVEGQIAEIEIERRAYGWQQLLVASRQGILVSWSPTGAPGDAVLIARAIRTETPGDLFSSTQTWRATCAPHDVRRFLLDYAQAHLTRAPETNLRFSDADPDDPEAYLLGRSAMYRVDPRTHAITVVDDLVGVRTVDLTNEVHSSGELTDGPGSFGSPLAELRAEVEANWTQEASGILDISGRIGQIRSYDPNFGSRIATAFTASNTTGWTVDTDGIRIRKRRDPDGSVWVNRVPLPSEYRATYNKYSLTRLVIGMVTDEHGQNVLYEDKFMPVPADNEQPAPWSGEPPKTAEPGEPPIPAFDNNRHALHTAAVGYDCFTYDVEYFPLGYSVSQSRSETLKCTLYCGVQSAFFDPRVAEADSTETHVSASLDDVFEGTAPPVWVSGQSYFAGNRVSYNRQRYTALRPNLSQFFIPADWSRDPDLGSPENLVALFDSHAGATYVDHIFCRLRKEARRRLRAKNLTFTVSWEAGWHVTTADSVRIEVPWTDTTWRSVVGKVVAVERRWSGEEGPTVQIEIGISFGVDHRIIGGANREVLDMSILMGESDLARSSIDFRRLQDPTYAMPAGISIVGQAEAQRVRMRSLAQSGGDPAQASVEVTTKIGAGLRPLIVDGDLHRNIVVHGELLTVPQGISL